MKNLLFILLLIAGNLSFAQQFQCPCLKPVNNIYEGCVPFTLYVQDCSNSPSNTSKRYSYDNGRTFSNKLTDTVYTFTNPGTYKVIQSGNFPCSLGTSITRYDTISIVVKETPLPAPRILPCANNFSLVSTPIEPYDEYIVQVTPQVKIPKGGSAVVNMENGITLKGNYINANCGASGDFFNNNAPINFSKPTSPIIQYYNDTTIFIKFEFASDPFFFQLSEKTSNSSFVPIDTAYIIPEFFIADNSNRSRCFRITPFDNCGQIGESSEEFCTIHIKGTALNQRNEILWESPPPSSTIQYALYKNGQNLGQVPYPFIDTSIVCGENYCYQLFYLQNGKTNVSRRFCLIAKNNAIPPVVEDISSTVMSNQVNLSWTSPLKSTSPTYSIFYSTSRSSFNSLTSTTTNTFTDDIHNPSTSRSCYKINYKDKCGNEALLSAETCPVFLNGKYIDAYRRQLNWQPYIGWANGVKEYWIEKLDEAGQVYQSFSAGAVFDFEDKGLDTVSQKIIYRIKAISNNGEISYSNTWQTEQKSNFQMPNAFTPNGDGLNDIFKAEGLFISQFRLEIWNRNGESVYVTNNFKEGWDGNINGGAAMADNYMYSVEATDKLGKVYKRNGTLQLIK